MIEKLQKKHEVLERKIALKIKLKSELQEGADEINFKIGKAKVEWKQYKKKTDMNWLHRAQTARKFKCRAVQDLSIEISGLRKEARKVQNEINANDSFTFERCFMQVVKHEIPAHIYSKLCQITKNKMGLIQKSG